MVILDVREKEEFQAEHVAESLFCPLSQFDLLAPGILKNIKESEVVIMCRTGKRATMAINELKKFDLGSHQFTTYEGGLVQWKKEGKPVIGLSSVFPIMRQVQIVASSMIFLSFLAAKFISADLVYLALLPGFGLALAGYTGICPMVYLLQKMPWNNKKVNDGNISSKPNCCG